MPRQGVGGKETKPHKGGKTKPHPTKPQRRQNKTMPYQLVITPFYAVVKRIYTHFGNPFKPGGKRGVIRGFSSESRRRLIRYLLSLEEAPKVMITLTYPGEWPKDPREWKRHLHNFRRELERKFPECWFVWKLEFQKRGAPHFHLLGDFRKNVPFAQLRRWVSYVWYRIVGSGDEKHFKAGTNIEFLDGKKKVRMYVSKYVNKEDCLRDEEGNLIPVGRWWGKFGKLPAQWKLYYELDHPEFVMIRRIVRRWVKGLTKRLRKNYWGFVNYLRCGDAFTVWWDQVVMIRLLKFLLLGRELKFRILSQPGKLLVIP